MRLTSLLRKITPVPVRGTASAVQPHQPRYVAPPPRALSRAFDAVTEENRFLSLEMLLERFSSYAGRRQYRLAADLTAHTAALRELGLDWQEIKALPPDELRTLTREVLDLPDPARALLLTMVDHKLCGVVRRGHDGREMSVCLADGCAAHGWRCGRRGHLADVYFEGKPRANPAVLGLGRRSAVLRHRGASEDDGVAIDVHPAPDFRIAGRAAAAAAAAAHPRVWRAPSDGRFVVEVMGYEFRVHPTDPRAQPQIEAAAAQWDLHAAVVQQVLWELLELRATARPPQPLAMAPGELGGPDSPQSYAAAFTTVRAAAGNNNSSNKEEVVEHRMRAADGSGDDRPWFTPPLPQRFTPDGVPALLPYAPTVVIKGSFRGVRRMASPEDVSQHLLQPVMDVHCFVHPAACFWLPPAEEERLVAQLLDYAGRLPYPLPFSLFLRVDGAKELREDPGIAARKEELMREKANFFDLRNFTRVHAGEAEGTAAAETTDIHTND